MNIDQAAILLVPANASIAEAWRARGSPMLSIPLLPDEIAQFTAEGQLRPTLTDEEARLIAELAQGRTIDRVARALKLSRRSVERRIRKLKERTGTQSIPELVTTFDRSQFSKGPRLALAGELCPIVQTRAGAEPLDVSGEANGDYVPA